MCNAAKHTREASVHLGLTASWNLVWEKSETERGQERETRNGEGGGGVRDREQS